MTQLPWSAEKEDHTGWFSGSSVSEAFQPKHSELPRIPLSSADGS